LIRFLTNQPDQYNEWRLIWNGPWSQWTLIILGVLLVAALFWSWHSSKRLSNFKQQAALFVLRTLGAVGVWMLIAGPAFELRHVQKIHNDLPVFVDTSASMRLRMGPKKPTRIQQVKSFFKRNKAFFDDLANKQKVAYYTFDRDIKALGAPLQNIKANGDQTNLLRIGQFVQDKLSSKPLAGVILVTDGVDTLAQSEQSTQSIAKRSSVQQSKKETTRRMRQLLQQLQKRKVPVHVIAPPKTKSLKDIAITDIYGDAFAFLHNTATVEARVRVYGYESGSISVTLYREGQILRNKVLQLRPGRTDYLVSFKFRPRKAGQFIYSVRTTVMADEAVRENNQKSFILKILRDRIRVLQVAGRPGWDVRFMRRLLKKNASIDLISFFILRTHHNPQTVPLHEIALIPFPSRELFTKSLPTFDLVIFQNFNYGPYLRKSYLANIAKFVRGGGAFMMLGGDLSFGAGGYLDTPVERMLPVKLHLGQVDTRWFRPTLTPTGQHHPITQLVSSATANKQIWSSLPKVDGTNLVGDAKGRGVVLLSHPTLKTDQGNPLPILTVGQFGKGRALALTVDGSWRWNFANVGQSGTQASYYRFWNNAIRWLIRDPELERVRVTSFRSSYRSGEQARFRIRLLDKQYRPQKKGKVRLTITRAPEGKVLYRDIKSVQPNGSVFHQWLPPTPGIYRLRAEADWKSRSPIKGETLIEVQGLHHEYQRLLPNEALFSALKTTTKGRVIRFNETIRQLALTPPTIVRIDRSKTVEVWHNVYCLLLFFLLFGVEWGLRRSWGLP
jgi:uncharacterized membrane protein